MWNGGFELRVDSVRSSGFLVVRFLVLAFALCLGVVTSAGQAQAQNVDWILAVEDGENTGTSYAAGGVIDYTLRITNAGTQAAPATTLTFEVPPNATLVGVSAPLTNCSPTSGAGPLTMTCTVPALAADEDITPVVQVTSDIQGSIQVGAEVVTNPAVESPGSAGNNADVETTTLTKGAEIGLDLTLAPTAASGSEVDFVWTATNNGPHASDGFTISFPAPTGVSNMSPPAGCNLSGGEWTCNIPGPVAVGASVTRTFTGQIDAVGGSDVTVQASVTNQTPPDPNADNNTATGTVAITAGTDVSITKSRSPGGSNLLVGDTVDFTLTPRYTGDAPATVTVTDTIPGNYQIDNVVEGGWTCTQAGQDVTCTRSGPTGGGSNTSLGSIIVETTVVSPGSAQNTATVSSTGPADQDLSNNSDTDGVATIEVPEVDLRANKSGPNPPLMVQGNSGYQYAISTSNIGNADFWGTIEMVDTIPAGLRLDSIVSASGWTCSPASGTGPMDVTCTRVYTQALPLPPNGTTPSVVFSTTAMAPGTIANQLHVSSPDSNIPEDPSILPNNTITHTSSSGTQAASADVRPIKTASPATLPAGDLLTYTIEVVNDGPSASANVRVNDNIRNLINNQTSGPNPGFVSLSVAANAATGFSAADCANTAYNPNGRNLACDIPTLPVCISGNNCPVITVQVRPGGNGGTYTNTATATSLSVPDPNLGNNSNTASYALQPRADVTVAKTAGPNPIAAGQNLTYVITASNIDNGLSTAENVSITENLPENVLFVSATPSAGSCSGLAPNTLTTTANRTLTCALGNINNGAQRTVTVVVQPTNVTRGLDIGNDVAVDTDTTETNPNNNDASAIVHVSEPVVDLLINKTDNTDPLQVGNDVTYTVTVRNNGPSTSENVVMTDTLPPALLSYQSYTATSNNSPVNCGTVPAVGDVGGTLVCAWPFIKANSSEQVTLTMRGLNRGTATNSATVKSDETDQGWESNTLNNNATADTTLRTKTNISLTKTGPATAVGLMENFNFTIGVNVAAPGGGTAEAEEVKVNDTLPGNMELTGTPTAVVASGNASTNSCTGAAGGTSFSCDFGLVDSGSQINITVPVRVTAANADPYSRTNSATVTTESFEDDESDNTDTHTVQVVSSSIAGTVFRDFAEDEVMNNNDSGVADVQLSLNGTDLNGNPVSRTITADANGDYSFDYLPEGTYTVRLGVIPSSVPDVAYLTSGPASNPLNLGGNRTNNTTISTINVPKDSDGVDYDFALISQARVGIAKQVSGAVTANDDGSFNVTFGLVVENFSQEPLTNIAVTDQIAGADPLFGTLATPANPATDPMVNGTYAIVAAPSGSCGGLNAGFNGAGNTVVATGFNLGIGGSCNVAFTLRVMPASVPANYENQAVVTAEGQWSGQTSTGPNANPQLADQSDDGANPDPNNNGQANENGENDPTPVSHNVTPAIALIKTSDISGLSNPVAVGDVITYGFTVTNTGPVTLTNITLSDTLAGLTLSGGPITSLAPGASNNSAFSGTYAITQADINAGQVTNQATTTGTDPYGNDVTDQSGTANDNDTPLVTPINQGPQIALIKTADTSALGDPVQAGDVITYGFTVTNTGNVRLTNVTLTDVLAGLTISGGPIATLEPGAIDSTTFSGTYALTQADIIAGQVTNHATVSGDDPSGNPVTDDSGTANDNDTPTVVPLNQVPAIDLDKVADTSGLPNGAQVGDVIPYNFIVTNTGNMILTNVTVTDLLPNIVLNGSPIPQLDPGQVDNTTYTATYTVTQADVLANEVINDASVTGTWGPNPGEVVTDDDSETVQVGSIEANPETFPPFTTDGGTTTSMLDSDLLNNGPATLDNVTITVLNADPGVTLDTTTGLITLAPGYPAGEHTVEYEICSQAIPTLCDTTVETVVQGALPGIEATKTQTFYDVNGDGHHGVGDRLDYSITVENTGNTPLEDVVVTEMPVDLDGNPLTLASGPDFVSADMGSAEGYLEIGETATYTASIEVTLQAVNSGGIENNVVADAMPVYGPDVPGDPSPVSDMSDNGIDTDGNTEDDPTRFVFTAAGAADMLRLTKTTPEDIVRRGQTVPYTITVSNDNNFVVGPVDVVDTLPAHFLADPASATIDGVSVAVTVNGLVVTWEDVSLPAQTTRTFTLNARVLNGARAGTHTNSVSVFEADDGDLLIGAETADVRILPEAVFDCSDVIGKVFEDHNGNGYQDPPGEARQGDGITDQNYGGGKGKYTPAPLVERGIPGVRLVSPDGTVVTTDENGLYSVPCAALPADRGSNFILKLDERTLPAGYRPTTENPRVVRLTPGVMSEINFGASIGKVVRVDLNRAAFTTGADGKPAIGRALDNGIRRMVPALAGEPIVLRLAWHVPASAGAEAVSEGRMFMKLVEDRIRAEWRKAGRTQLRIETTIVRAGQ